MANEPGNKLKFGVMLVVDGKVTAQDFPIPSQEEKNALFKEMIDATRCVEPKNELEALRFKMWRRMIEWYRQEYERMEAATSDEKTDR